MFLNFGYRCFLFIRSRVQILFPDQTPLHNNEPKMWLNVPKISQKRPERKYCG